MENLKNENLSQGDKSAKRVRPNQKTDSSRRASSNGNNEEKEENSDETIYPENPRSNS